MIYELGISGVAASGAYWKCKCDCGTIKTIRGSKTKEIAHKNLIRKFKLSTLQADAILEMRLQTLAGMERKKIQPNIPYNGEVLSFRYL